MMNRAPAGSDEEGPEALHVGMKRWALRSGLRLVLRYYDEMERLISEAVDPTDRASVVDEPIAHAYNAANAVLRACAYLTEAAYIISDGAVPRRRRPILDQLKPHLKRRGLDLGGQQWETVKDAFEVRHCLLHANGRLSLMEEAQADDLRSIIAKHPEGIHLHHRDRIRIQRPFVVEVARAVNWVISGVRLA